jgi:competence protein ComEC
MASSPRSVIQDRGARSLLWPEIESHPGRFSTIVTLRIRNNPMLLLAACFATGVLCRPWWQPPVPMIVACLSLLLIAALARRHAPPLAWFSTGIFWVALGWTAAALQPSSQDTSLLRYADQLQRNLEGRVVAVRHLAPKASSAQPSAEERTDGENAFATRDAARQATEVLELQANAIEDVSPDISRMTTITGGALITLVKRAGGTDVEVPCGARIRVTVRLHPPQRYLDPGVWSYADALQSRGISVESTADPATIQVLDATHTPAACRFAAAQRWSSSHLNHLTQTPMIAHMPQMLRLTSADTAMLSAMLFGDRTLLQRSVRTAFERTGSFHLFVVAGMHIALLLAAVFFCLQRLHAPRWIAAALAIAMTTVYAFMTGFGAPAQRALLMSSVYLLMRLLGRERHALNALGAATLGMLALRADVLTEAGFQMTVLAVFAIAGIAVPLGERSLMPYARSLRDIGHVRHDPYLRPRLTQLRVSLRWIGHALASRSIPRTQTTLVQRAPSLVARAALYVCELILITLTAEIVMALPMAIYFHRATPFAAPANLLALPMVGLLMACAIATFVASLLHPLLAVVPATCTALLMHGVSFVISRLSALHGADVRMPAPYLLGTIFAGALWCIAVVLLRRSPPWAGRIACGLVPLGLALVLWPRTPTLHRDLLEFTAIDVGQGDSLLLASPQGQTMLIDAGGPTGSSAPVDENGFDVGEEVVSPYLWSRGLRRIDVAVLTHAHSDHIGGMSAVLRNFRPRELWLSIDFNEPRLQALLQEAMQRHIVIRRLHTGDSITWSGTHVQILSPSPNYQPRSTPTNDDSLVMRISYGLSSALAAGDAEHDSETAMLTNHVEPVTLLKVGHHGSNTSTSANLLAALHPSAAVISCGLGNRFGHPRIPVLQRLQAADVRTSRTDDMGAVQYLLHEDGRIDTHVLASNP